MMAPLVCFSDFKADIYTSPSQLNIDSLPTNAELHLGQKRIWKIHTSVVILESQYMRALFTSGMQVSQTNDTLARPARLSNHVSRSRTRRSRTWMKTCWMNKRSLQF